MELKKALFLLQAVLLIQNIGFGDTNSSDEEFKQRKKRGHNIWSSEMKAQFAEVYEKANPNEPQHFKKVVNEWFKLHPDSNDTENAMHHRYKMITQQFKENSANRIVVQRKRSNNVRTSEMEAQLADICSRTNPNEPYHFERVKYEWFNSHPNSNMTEKDLHHKYLRILHQTELGAESEHSIGNFDETVGFNDINSTDERIERRKKRSYIKWSSEMNAQLSEIYRNTNPKEPYHFERLKNEWYNRNPDSNITENSLRHKYRQNFCNNEHDGKRRNRDFKWNEEKYADLVDAYLHSHPYQRSSPIQLSDEWKRRYHDCPNFDNAYLSRRARMWIEKRKLDVEGGTSKRMFEWNTKQDSDVYHIYHVTRPEGRSQPIYMHKIWTELHPNHEDLTSEQLAERFKYLQRNRPDENFPWTSVQKQELLNLYHSTNPGLANQGQRIYDIWSKIHPRYSFMTPYYLQIHASTIVHQKEAKGKIKKKKTNFTDEQNANLFDMYCRLRKPNKPLYDFHKAWVREYPSLAYLTTHNLLKRIHSNKQFCKTRVREDEEQSKSRQIEHRKYHKYTPEERAVLLDAFHRTFPREYGHSERLLKEWINTHKGATDISGTGLRRIVNKWEQEQLDRKRKAPMVIPKTEVESETGSSTSDMSE